MAELYGWVDEIQDFQRPWYIEAPIPGTPFPFIPFIPMEPEPLPPPCFSRDAAQAAWEAAAQSCRTVPVDLDHHPLAHVPDGRPHGRPDSRRVLPAETHRTAS